MSDSQYRLTFFQKPDSAPSRAVLPGLPSQKKKLKQSHLRLHRAGPCSFGLLEALDLTNAQLPTNPPTDPVRGLEIDGRVEQVGRGRCIVMISHACVTLSVEVTDGFIQVSCGLQAVSEIEVCSVQPNQEGLTKSTLFWGEHWIRLRG